jgi:hypothetical protein
MIQKYIRLQVEQPLNDSQLDELFEIVDDTTTIILTSAFDDDGEKIGDDVAITMYVDDNQYYYEMIVDADTDSDDLKDIVVELEDVLPEEFEIELVRE